MPHLLPEDVRRLIRRHLPTMAHVDLLAALVRSAPELCSGDELARRAHLDAAAAEGYLNTLILAGLATAEGSGDARRFVFAPLSPVQGQTVRDLVELMSRRPVALVRYVYDRQEPPEASLE
jgi:hypothetical protein